MVPEHPDIHAIVLLHWVGRDAVVWHTRGAAGPFELPAESGRWSVRDPEISAQIVGVPDLHRQGVSRIRLN